MQSAATDVSTYLDEVAGERRDVLERLRALCQETLVGFEESMEYGMPTYKRDGVPEIAFASQKQYIALYAKSEVVDAHRADLAGLNVGKSCIRFRKPAQIDFDVVRAILVQSAASSETPG